MTKAWFALLVGCLLGAGTMRAADDTRFSQSLNVTERTEAGVHRLSAEQLAILDALVRHDTAARSGPTADPAAPAVFSQRLSADERRNAGLTVLAGGELSRLDSLVERHENARLARTLLAPPAYLARTPVKPVEAREGRQIHGSFSLSYGVGSGGYSEKTGSMVLNFEDPDHHLAVTVGYTESHVKGGYGYRGDYYGDSLREYPGGPDPFRP